MATAQLACASIGNGSRGERLHQFGGGSANFAPATDIIQISPLIFANIGDLLAATHDDGHGNAVITDATLDTITIQSITVTQLLAHQGDFHFV
jgi:hypothetical protein